MYVLTAVFVDLATDCQGQGEQQDWYRQHLCDYTLVRRQKMGVGF